MNYTLAEFKQGEDVWQKYLVSVRINLASLRKTKIIDRTGVNFFRVCINVILVAGIAGFSFQCHAKWHNSLLLTSTYA